MTAALLKKSGIASSCAKRCNVKSAADDTCYCGVIGPRKLQQSLACAPTGNVRDSQCGELRSYLR